VVATIRQAEAEAAARTITELATQHKRECESADCTLSLSVLIPVVEELLGRGLSYGELKNTFL
jgi:hypothetical protein